MSKPVKDLANRLHSTAIHLLRQARMADRETGLSPERLSLLSVLVFAGPQTLSRLAHLEQVSRPAISRSVSSLVELGLVRTERSDRDRRTVTAEATPRGRRLMDAGRRRRIERIAAGLEGLTVLELETLSQAARILNDDTNSPT